MQAKIDEMRLGQQEGSISPEQEAERQVFENIYFEVVTKLQTIIDLEQALTQANNQAEAQQCRRRVGTLLEISRNKEIDNWILGSQR